MTGDYSAQAATAKRMISAKGASVVTFSRETGAVDPLTQALADPLTYAAPAVAFPLATQQVSRIFGANAVGKRHLQIYIALDGVTETPKGGDKFTWLGQGYALLDEPELLAPSGNRAILATGYAEAA